MEAEGRAAAFSRWRASGQAECLGELLKSYRDRAYAVALRMTHAEPDAEDVVQQAFVKLLTRTQGLDDAAAFERSVFRAVVQCSLDALRAKKRRARREQPGLDERMGTLMNLERGPAGASEDRETIELLRQAVAEMPEEERAPVVLCYYQGMTHEEAARTLDLPRTTMSFRLDKGMARLRRAVEGRGKKTSAALLVALLWSDGAAAAPEGLCAALDAALPGRPCGELPALARPAAPPALPPAFPLGAPALVAGVAIAGLLCALAVLPARVPSPASQSVTLKPAPATPARDAGEGEAAVSGTALREAGETTTKEEDMFGRKAAALALTGAILFPAALPAGEGNADVAKVIAQIEARRTAKAEASAKASPNTTRADNGGVFVNPAQSTTTAPGAAVGQGAWGR